MKCPICQTELKFGHRGGFSKGIHIAYYCPKTDCTSFGIVWDGHGYIYHDDVYPEGLEFIDENPCAFGSEARREYALGKHPRQDRTVFALYPFKWKIVTNYDVNTDGKVDNVRKELKTLIKKKGVYQLYESTYSLFKRCRQDFKKLKQDFKETSDALTKGKLLDSFNPPDWDKRWGRKFASWWFRVTDGKLYKELKEE